MNAWTRLTCVLLIALSMPLSAAEVNAGHKRLFLCRSPLLAFDFWNALKEMHQKGVTMTPKIAQEVCDGMKAGEEPQCIRVDADDFKPIASGWGGAMAMSDGKTRVWFRNPDTLGWVHPEYYVQFVNSK